MPDENGELQELRQLLASLEQHIADVKGISLVDELVDCATNFFEHGRPESREQRVTENILSKYGSMAEQRARQLLSDFDSVTNETALCLQYGMQELDGLDVAMPPTFHDARVSLLEGVAQRSLNRILNPPRQSGDHGPFVASRSHFHRLECEWAERIADPIEYETHEEAVRAGKKPCKTCRA